MKATQIILITIGLLVVVVVGLHVIALVGVYYASRALDHQTTSTTPPPSPAPKAESPAPAKNTTPTYTIKKGDTLVKIARAHGVRTEDLCKLNQIDDPDKIHLAQVLQLPRKN
jgi:LysM repeat protein